MDWSLMLDPAYDAFGVAASLVAAPGTPAVTVTVIDKTAGVAVDDGSGPELITVRPAATVRTAELIAAGLCRSDLDRSPDGATIAFNGKCWRVKAAQPIPTPNGEAAGELLMVLQEEPA